MEKKAVQNEKMSRQEAENVFYEWLDNEFELSREDVANNEIKMQSAELVISTIRNGRVTLGNDVLYKLRSPLGNITEITLKSRIEVSKLPTSTKDSIANQALKMLEARTGVPATILGSMDVFDFNRAAAITAFFG